MTSKLTSGVLGLVLVVAPVPTFAADGDPPPSPEVTAAMQPYLDGYKLAGAIGIIADKNGKVHYKNLLGCSGRRGEETDQRRQHLLDRVDDGNVRRCLHHDAGG